MTTLTIFLYDGRRQPFLRGNVLLHVRKGNVNLVSKFVDKPQINVNFDEDPGPVAIVASHSQTHQCGYFASSISRPVYLMLVHKAENLDFVPNLATEFSSTGSRAAYAGFLGSDPQPERHIAALRDTNPKALACLLNVLESIRWLPNGPDVIQTLEKIDLRGRAEADPGGDLWQGLQQDRIFAVAKDTLPALLKASPFPFADAPVALHKPADEGFKETGRFGEANLNFSLRTKNIDLPGKILADIDLDYFDDKVAHIALEVIPNELSKLFGNRKLTNPAQIYAFRWMNTKNCQKPLFLDGEQVDPDPDKRPDFDPLYTISPG